ncbi:MAG TPA: hypothetical protein VGJ69_13265 [Pyrinomonadaceae bacterium]
MNMLRRINLSAALIVLVCFFLPWEQVSCGGAQDTLSGLDLARHEHTSLWLVPLMMLLVLVFGLVRRRMEKPQLFALVSIASGVVAAFLMNDERSRVNDMSGSAMIAARLTGWFWLAFISTLAVVITAVAILAKRQRGP